MRIAIMQPTYLPWIGYFDLIDQVRTFVFLDTVQFDKRSWQQRNRIKGRDGLQWLTVPVVSAGRFNQRIEDVEIQDDDFRTKHLRTLELYYAKAPHFGDYYDGVRALLEAPGRSLADLNIALIEHISKVLGLRAQFVRASGLEIEGRQSALLADICARLGADDYLSPPGSADYLLGELDAFATRGVSVAFQQFVHPEYLQAFPPFASHACVLDLLFNEGPRALDVIRSGRRPALTAAALAAAHTAEDLHQ